MQVTESYEQNGIKGKYARHNHTATSYSEKWDTDGIYFMNLLQSGLGFNYIVIVYVFLCVMFK